MTGVDFHPEAEPDLDDIWEYIAEGSVVNADRVMDEIAAALVNLPAFPHQGFERPELTNRSVRFIVVRPYLIAYAPNQTPLWVIAVLHGRMHPRVMAAILRGR